MFDILEYISTLKFASIIDLRYLINLKLAIEEHYCTVYIGIC